MSLGASQKIEVSDNIAAACPVRRAIESGIEFSEQITHQRASPDGNRGVRLYDYVK